MNKKNLLLILLTSFISTINAQWIWQHPYPIGTQIEASFFSTPAKGYAVGLNGQLIHTLDSGKTWIQLQSGTDKKLFDVYFVNENLGFIAGETGTILKTQNGGLSWNKLITGVTSDFNDIFFIDSINGYASMPSSLKKTTNGGVTWSIVNLGVSIKDLYFFTKDKGIVIATSGQIRKTSNGGTTWQTIASGTSSTLYSIFFCDSLNGYISGGTNIILKTSDGGNSWTLHTITSSSSYLYSIFFINPQIGITVNSSGYVYKTTDGGLTWVQINSTSIGLINTLFFANNNIACAFGSFGKVVRSVDEGESWTILSHSFSAANLNSIYFINPLKGFVVGANGNFFNTLNAGITWTKNTNIPSNYGLGKIQFTDNLTGYICNNPILKSIDGGDTWNTKNTPNQVLALDFCNNNIGYAVGPYGALWKTADGSESWFTLSTGTTKTIFSVLFLNPDTGFIAGQSGLLSKTIDGGLTWNVQTGLSTAFDFKDIFFNDEQSGWAVGTNGQIYKTTNGGTTWSLKLSGTTQSLNAVYAINSNNINICAGTNILHSINGGISWTLSPTFQGLPLLDVFFTDSCTGYTVGSSGIFTTFIGGEILNASTDTLKIHSIWNDSDSSKCNTPYYAKLFLNTFVSGDIFNFNDSISFKILFGDGYDTTFYKPINYLPTDFSLYINHYYLSSGNYSITCIANSSCGLSDTLVINNYLNITDTCNIITTSNIDSYLSTDIFPNPTTGKIEITGIQNSIVEILGIAGQLLRKIESSSSKIIIDISSFKSGLYLIKVNSNKGTLIKKIIKE